MWDETMRILGFLTAFFVVAFMVLYLLNRRLESQERNERRPTTSSAWSCASRSPRACTPRSTAPRPSAGAAEVRIEPYGDIETYELRGHYRSNGVD